VVERVLSEALRAVASCFLLKDIEPAELRQAVRVVAAGDALLSPSVTRRRAPASRRSSYTAVRCHQEARVVLPANDAQHEHVVAAITTPPHLAATWENAMIWDGAAALARCTVPVLYIQSQAPDAAVERFRMVCPRIVVESVRLGCCDQRQAAAQRDHFKVGLDAARRPTEYQCCPKEKVGEVTLCD
jgi:hypothetical protein